MVDNIYNFIASVKVHDLLKDIAIQYKFAMEDIYPDVDGMRLQYECEFKGISDILKALGYNRLVLEAIRNTDNFVNVSIVEIPKLCGNTLFNVIFETGFEDLKFEEY